MQVPSVYCPQLKYQQHELEIEHRDEYLFCVRVCGVRGVRVCGVRACGVRACGVRVKIP